MLSPPVFPHRGKHPSRPGQLPDFASACRPRGTQTPTTCLNRDERGSQEAGGRTVLNVHYFSGFRARKLVRLKSLRSKLVCCVMQNDAYSWRSMLPIVGGLVSCGRLSIGPVRSPDK